MCGPGVSSDLLRCHQDPIKRDADEDPPDDEKRVKGQDDQEIIRINDRELEIEKSTDDDEALADHEKAPALEESGPLPNPPRENHS